ncbi:BrnT family toxin [Accumulibacter sp.]|uniref:BrnT family toxin n=1 Tax=Accumulibacter sp. TaxID=2053492 RepID=UPI0035B22843
MRHAWDEARRHAHLKKHGRNLATTARVFAGPLLPIDDDREDHGEQRVVGIGLPDLLMVQIVPVEPVAASRDTPLRKADSDETDLPYRYAGCFWQRAESPAAVREPVGRGASTSCSTRRSSSMSRRWPADIATR